MSTFHPFPRLPLELRRHIWEMIVETVRYVIYELHAGYTLILYTVSQRTVYVSRPRDSNETLGRLISSTAIPATLHSCREARNCRLYQRTFFEVEFRYRYGGRRKIRIPLLRAYRIRN
jgi:hypothetical protein